MRGYAETVGTVWARARGLLVLAGGIALGIQFLANAPAAEKAATVALVLLPVLVAAAILRWARGGRSPLPRILGGYGLLALAALALQAAGGIPVGGALIASIDAVPVLVPLGYCLVCAAVDGLWSPASA